MPPPKARLWVRLPLELRTTSSIIPEKSSCQYLLEHVVSLKASLARIRKIAISKTLSTNTLNHMPHLIDGIGGTVIVPSRKLPDIPTQVFHTHLVISSLISSFQHRPKGLNTVSVSLFSHVLSHGMPHAFMLKPRKPVIGCMIIRVNFSASLCVILDTVSLPVPSTTDART